MVDSYFLMYFSSLNKYTQIIIDISGVFVVNLVDVMNNIFVCVSSCRGVWGLIFCLKTRAWGDKLYQIQPKLMLTNPCSICSVYQVFCWKNQCEYCWQLPNNQKQGFISGGQTTSLQPTARVGKPEGPCFDSEMASLAWASELTLVPLDTQVSMAPSVLCDIG